MAKSVPYAERKFDRAKATQYNTQYRRDNFDQVNFVLPKGYKELVKEHASLEGVTMSEWIRSLIDEKINK